MQSSQSRFKNRSMSKPSNGLPPSNSSQNKLTGQQAAARRFKNASSLGENNDQELAQVQRDMAQAGRIQRALGGSLTVSQGGPVPGINSQQHSGHHTTQSSVDHKHSGAKFSSATQLMNQTKAPANMGGPITDVRSKQRHASTLNVEDLPPNGQTNGTGSSQQINNFGQLLQPERSSNNQLPRGNGNQNVIGNKKFVEMATKANANMLVSQQKQQQLLINQFNKGNNPNTREKIELTKESFDRTADMTGARQNMIARGSQGTPQQPAKASLLPSNNHKRKTPTAGGKKAFQQNMMNMFNSGPSTVTGSGMAGSLRESAGHITSANSALTGDQLRFMMQREKFNNSALIQTSQPRQLDNNFTQQALPTNNAPQQVSLSKVYASQPKGKTPTATQQAHPSGQVITGHGLQDHLQHFTNQNITSQMNQTKPSKKEKGQKQQSAQSQMIGSSANSRAASQLAPSHNLLFLDSQVTNAASLTQAQQQMAAQHARKGSMDSKVQFGAGNTADQASAFHQQRSSLTGPSGNGNRGGSNRAKKRQ